MPCSLPDSKSSYTSPGRACCNNLAFALYYATHLTFAPIQPFRIITIPPPPLLLLFSLAEMAAWSNAQKHGSKLSPRVHMHRNSLEVVLLPSAISMYEVLEQ
jgi:hypothetical protein